MRLLSLFLFCPAFLLIFSCIQEPVSTMPVAAPAPRITSPKAETTTFQTGDLFSDLLADGFSSPFGEDQKNWVLFSKQGEVYKTGCDAGENRQYKGNAKEPHPVFSIAKGEVLEAGNSGTECGKIVLIKHQYIENARIRTVFSLYTHLDRISVKKADRLDKGASIGSLNAVDSTTGVTFLHFEIRKESMAGKAPDYRPAADHTTKEWIEEHYEDPTAFIQSHQQTFVPAHKKLLLVAVKHEYKMQLYQSGKLLKTYPIALSQSPVGHKQQEGDNKLPEGEYRIIQKTKGPFAGDYAEYLGPRFLRLNYPNNYDAAAALRNKKITAKQAQQITTANNNKMEPNKNTGLGGGIGIHGWAGDWPANSKHLTWGCISMQNKDLLLFFDEVPLYTDILIFP